MALKPDRDYNLVTDITQFWQDPQATGVAAGGVAGVVTQGSGVAMADTQNVVAYVANPSGTVAKGILVHPVNPPLSATRDFINFENQETRPGDKVTLIRKGWVVTDMLVSGITPSAGDAAYLAGTGLMGTTQATGAPQVGRFEGSVDANGFAKVYMDI